MTTSAPRRPPWLRTIRPPARPARGAPPRRRESDRALSAPPPGSPTPIWISRPSVLDRLAARGLLPTTPERFLEGLAQSVRGAVQGFARRLLGGLGQFVPGLVSAAISLFGIVFLAVYFLADARRIEAATLRATPRHYRRDVRALWDAFRFTLSRYIGGLGVSLAIQGVLSAVALSGLGVPYALLLGAWVSVTALVPYLGAWIGAIPAVLLAFTVSPTTALLTALLYLVIQQLESNVLTPRIQGQAVRVHPILIFLAVVAGGALFGIVGVLFAVPVVAVLHVLFDFFRVRLRVHETPRAALRVARRERVAGHPAPERV